MEPALHALRKLAKDRVELTEDEAFSCLLYVAMQYARVPAQLDRAVELMRQQVEHAAMQAPQAREALVTGRHRIVMRKLARFDAFGTLLPAALKCLSVMEWEILLAPPFDEFVTTDNPVVALSRAAIPPEVPGLGLRSTFVIFPLSPKITFRLRHRWGDNALVALDTEDAELPHVIRRVQLSDEQVGVQKKMVGAYGCSYAVAQSEKPLIKLKRDLAKLFAQRAVWR